MLAKFPDGFTESIRNAPGFNEALFLHAHEEAAPVSIRLHPRKRFSHTFTDKVPWCPDAYYLPSRPQFSLDPFFHAGAYYVQEASGMFLWQLLVSAGVQSQPMRILDLCAAPGGKSTLISACMHPDGVLFSNETVRARLGPLVENIIKWGEPNSVVTNLDASAFSGWTHFFDLILVDAPCSGSGMFRKDPEAMREWSMAHVTHCNKRQQRILEDVLPALKPGGKLIYSTCSYATQENENIVEQLLNQGYRATSEQTRFEGIHRSEFGYRFYPGNVRGEGLFIAMLEKPVDAERYSTHAKNVFEPVPSNDSVLCTHFLRSDKTFHFIRDKYNIIACTDALHTALSDAPASRFMHFGIPLGEIKNGRLVPDHALAMSTELAKSIPGMHLTLPEALAYLRKNTLSKPEAEKGFTLMLFENIPLGFANVLNDRLNNLYPTAWRLRN